jgi:hypothetical protein
VAWLELKIDLKRTADALSRIADALDRAIPLQREPSTRKPAVFFNVDPGVIAEAEAESDRKREVGTE